MKDKLIIGKIVNTIGLKGLLKVMPITADINRFKSLKTFFIDNEKFNASKVSINGNLVNLMIEGINNIEQAEKLKNKDIVVLREDALKLKENEFFIADLIGIIVFDNKGSQYGKIIDVENYGANDIIVIEHNGREESVPFIENIFSKIDIENNVCILGDRYFEVVVWNLIF